MTAAFRNNANNLKIVMSKNFIKYNKIINGYTFNLWEKGRGEAHDEDSTVDTCITELSYKTVANNMRTHAQTRIGL